MAEWKQKYALVTDDKFQLTIQCNSVNPAKIPQFITFLETENFTSITFRSVHINENDFLTVLRHVATKDNLHTLKIKNIRKWNSVEVGYQTSVDEILAALIDTNLTTFMIKGTEFMATFPPSLCNFESFITQKLGNLTKLVLQRCDFKDDGAIVLANNLLGNTSLTELDLHANNTRNQGMLFLCEALEENNTLTALRLTVCSCEEPQRAIRSLSRLLSNSKALMSLDISNNYHFGDLLVDMFESLAHNTTLLSIYLCMNEMTIPTIMEFGKAMTINQTLQHADISSGFFDNTYGQFQNAPVETEELVQILANNYSLTDVYIEDGVFSTNPLCAAWLDRNKLIHEQKRFKHTKVAPPSS